MRPSLYSFLRLDYWFGQVDRRSLSLFRICFAALLLSHVHPSGSLDASPEDIQVTLDAVQAGKLLGIAVLDHLIVAQAGWVSVRGKGLGFG